MELMGDYDLNISDRDDLVKENDTQSKTIRHLQTKIKLLEKSQNEVFKTNSQMERENKTLKSQLEDKVKEIKNLKNERRKDKIEMEEKLKTKLKTMETEFVRSISYESFLQRFFFSIEHLDQQPERQRKQISRTWTRIREKTEHHSIDGRTVESSNNASRVRKQIRQSSPKNEFRLDRRLRPSFRLSSISSLIVLKEFIAFVLSADEEFSIDLDHSISATDDSNLFGMLLMEAWSIEKEIVKDHHWLKIDFDFSLEVSVHKSSRCNSIRVLWNSDWKINASTSAANALLSIDKKWKRRWNAGRIRKVQTKPPKISFLCRNSKLCRFVSAISFGIFLFVETSFDFHSEIFPPPKYNFNDEQNQKSSQLNKVSVRRSIFLRGIFMTAWFFHLQESIEVAVTKTSGSKKRFQSEERVGNEVRLCSRHFSLVDVRLGSLSAISAFSVVTSRSSCATKVNVFVCFVRRIVTGLFLDDFVCENECVDFVLYKRKENNFLVWNLSNFRLKSL